MQTSFNSPIERSREVLERASNQLQPDHVTIAVSGGTDSVVAADVMSRMGPEYGLEPDSITHIDTGAGIPQTKLVAKLIADMHNLEFIEQGYRKQKASLAWRILENGWPGAYGGSPMTGGHGLEWANRKDKPMNKVYVEIEGQQLWVSGARKLESKKRQGNVPDSGIYSDKPRRTWLSIIGGWTSAEKQKYIKERGLPVSETYLALGFSGECTACSFDERGLLTNINLLSPELGHALRTLAVWLYMRVKRGDVKLAPKRLCWGWEPGEEVDLEVQSQLSEESPAQSMVGCDDESCGTVERPGWVRKLPDTQIVTRQDVKQYWESGIGVIDRFPL